MRKDRGSAPRLWRIGTTLQEVQRKDEKTYLPTVLCPQRRRLVQRRLHKTQRRTPMRPFSDPIVFTHLLFGVNVLLYLYSGYTVLCLALLINSIASYLYHRSGERDRTWQKADHILCIVSLFFIFSHLLLYSGWLQVAGCIVWLALSLLIYSLGKTDYQFYHSIWHGCVFLGNVLVWVCLGGLHV